MVNYGFIYAFLWLTSMPGTSMENANFWSLSALQHIDRSAFTRNPIVYETLKYDEVMTTL